MVWACCGICSTVLVACAGDTVDRAPSPAAEREAGDGGSRRVVERPLGGVSDEGLFGEGESEPNKSPEAKPGGDGAPAPDSTGAPEPTSSPDRDAEAPPAFEGEGEGEGPPPTLGGPVSFDSCQAFEPCGGELEGQWRYVETCVDTAALGVESTLEQLCAAATLRSLTGEVTGTLTFVDGQARREGRAVMRGVLDVPRSCLPPFVPCSQLAPLLESSAGVQVDGCEQVEAGCSCQLVVESESFGPSAFSTASGVLSLDAPSAQLPYCVRGDSMVYDATAFEAEPGVHRLERVR